MQVRQGLQEMWTFSKRCLSSYLSAEGTYYKCLQLWRMLKYSSFNLWVW